MADSPATPATSKRRRWRELIHAFATGGLSLFTTRKACETPPNLAGMHWDGSYDYDGGRGFRDFGDTCPWENPGPCASCGRSPALGFASIYSDGVEHWYCHPDDGPSCYTQASIGVFGGGNDE